LKLIDVQQKQKVPDSHAGTKTTDGRTCSDRR